MNIGYNDIISYCSTVATPWSRPMKEDTKRRLLNLGSNIRANVLCVFLSSNFLKKERKLFRTPQTFFLMLEAKQIHSSATPNLFSIKVWKDGAFSSSSLNFKLMEMAKWRASPNNQFSLNWFRTQAIITRENTINNNLTNMPSQKEWNFGCHPH